MRHFGNPGPVRHSDAGLTNSDLIGIAVVFVLTILSVVMVLLAAGLAIATLAHARGVHPFDPLHFKTPEEQHAWFGSLSSPENGDCCSDSDGLRLEDPDWKMLSGDCQWAPSQTHGPAKYCVRLSGAWWIVPDNSLVSAKNKIGAAAVWPVYLTDYGTGKPLLDGKGAPRLSYIRCFMPGAGG